MNILFMTRRFYPSIGGVETHVLEVTRQLQQMGHRVTVLTEVFEQQKDSNWQNNGESATFVGKLSNIQPQLMPVGRQDWFKKLRIWLWIFRHRQLIEAADVIHCHDVYFWYMPFRLLYFRKKSFVTFHGYESYPISKKSFVVRKLSEIMSSGNICIGDFINKWYGTNPTYVLYGAVEPSKQHKKPLKNSALFFGRLDDQTGIMAYVNVYKKIKQSIPSFTLTVIGEGKLRSKLPDGVKYMHFTPGINKYIQSHEIIFVSRYLSILEALEAKRKVFAVYDNPIKRDYLEMTPFKDFIEISGSETELSTKVIQYLNQDIKVNTKVAQGYEWVSRQTWVSVASLYEKLWSRSNI